NGASAQTIARSGSGSAMRLPIRSLRNARYPLGQTSRRTSARSFAAGGAWAGWVRANALSAPSCERHDTIASNGSHDAPHWSHTRSYSATSAYDIRDERALRVVGPHLARRPDGAHDLARRDRRGRLP